MPIFRVKSVKIYTGQKNLHEYVRGIRDKYEVWLYMCAMLWYVCVCVVLYVLRILRALGITVQTII